MDSCLSAGMLAHVLDRLSLVLSFCLSLFTGDAALRERWVSARCISRENTISFFICLDDPEVPTTDVATFDGSRFDLDVPVEGRQFEGSVSTDTNLLDGHSEGRSGAADAVKPERDSHDVAPRGDATALGRSTSDGCGTGSVPPVADTTDLQVCESSSSSMEYFWNILREDFNLPPFDKIREDPRSSSTNRISSARIDHPRVQASQSSGGTRSHWPEVSRTPHQRSGTTLTPTTRGQAPGVSTSSTPKGGARAPAELDSSRGNKRGGSSPGIGTRAHSGNPLSGPRVPLPNTTPAPTVASTSRTHGSFPRGTDPILPALDVSTATDE